MECVEDIEQVAKMGRENALLGDYARAEQFLRQAQELAARQLREAQRRPAADRDARQACERWRRAAKGLRKEIALVERLQALITPGSARRETPRKPASPPDLAFGDPPPREEDVPVWKRKKAKRHAPVPTARTPAARTPAGRAPAGRQQPGGNRRRSSVESKAGRKSRGAAGGGGGDDRPSYAESMEGSPDLELIKQIESTMLTHDLNVRSEDIAGLQGAKTVLEEAVLYPQLMPSYYTGIRRPWKGVLLFGPPGTGKTMLAKAIASECRTCFFNVASSSLTSKWRGDSEKMVSILFDMARYYAPSTIFFDEIDSIASARGGTTEHEASRRVKSELLTQMDGVCNEADKTVVVLAATNLPWDLDDAIRRRLEKRIYIPLPDFEGRVALFRIATRDIKLRGEVDFEELAQRSEGYSGADIKNICHEASMMPIRRLIEEAKQSVAAAGGGRREMHDRMRDLGQNQPSSPPVCHADFAEALGKIQSSVGGRDLSRYQSWLDEYGAT